MPHAWCPDRRAWVCDHDTDWFRASRQRFGPRYITGVRSEESRVRQLREARWGVASPNTCAPLTRWTSLEVFAWLAVRDMPISPVYACTHGGSLSREHLRVDHLGGEAGTGHGRAEWERWYYREELARLDALKAA